MVLLFLEVNYYFFTFPFYNIFPFNFLNSRYNLLFYPQYGFEFLIHCITWDNNHTRYIKVSCNEMAGFVYLKINFPIFEHFYNNQVARFPYPNMKRLQTEHTLCRTVLNRFKHCQFQEFHFMLLVKFFSLFLSSCVTFRTWTWTWSVENNIL